MLATFVFGLTEFRAALHSPRLAHLISNHPRYFHWLMKQLLLTFLLLASSLTVWAQEYYLNLSRQRLEVPGRTVAVEQVLDGRRGDLPLGYVYQGLTNSRPMTVAFRQGVGPELTAFIQGQLPAQLTNHALVLCLRQLHLNEEHTQTLGMETATAYLNLDAYLHLPDGYHFVQSIASHTETKAPEVTALHAGHLARMLGYCLTQLSQADWAAAAALPALPLAQLPADVPVAQPNRQPAAPAAAILRERPRRGVYRSFQQFLANQPDSRRALRLDTIQPNLRSYTAWQQWQRVPWVRPLVADSLGKWSEPAGIWGFRMEKAYLYGTTSIFSRYCARARSSLQWAPPRSMTVRRGPRQRPERGRAMPRHSPA